jgi:hypothetical protein
LATDPVDCEDENRTAGETEVRISDETMGDMEEKDAGSKDDCEAGVE